MANTRRSPLLAGLNPEPSQNSLRRSGVPAFRNRRPDPRHLTMAGKPNLAARRRYSEANMFSPRKITRDRRDLRDRPQVVRERAKAFIGVKNDRLDVFVASEAVKQENLPSLFNKSSS